MSAVGNIVVSDVLLVQFTLIHTGTIVDPVLNISLTV